MKYSHKSWQSTYISLSFIDLDKCMVKVSTKVRHRYTDMTYINPTKKISPYSILLQITYYIIQFIISSSVLFQILILFPRAPSKQGTPWRTQRQHDGSFSWNRCSQNDDVTDSNNKHWWQASRIILNRGETYTSLTYTKATLTFTTNHAYRGGVTLK